MDKTKNFLKKTYSYLTGTAFILIAVLVVLSMVFYNENDPSFTVASNNTEIKNNLGIVGAYVSDFFIQFFGIFSYCISLILMKIGYNIIREKLNRYNVFLKIINFLIFIITGCAITTYNFANVNYFANKNIGGYIGYYFINVFMSGINIYLFFSFTYLFFIFSITILLDLNFKIWLLYLCKIKNFIFNVIKILFVFLWKCIKKIFSNGENRQYSNIPQYKEEEYRNNRDYNYRKLIEQQNLKIKELEKYIYSKNNSSEQTEAVKDNKVFEQNNEKKDKKISSFTPFNFNGVRHYVLPPINLLDGHKIMDNTLLSKNEFIEQATLLKRVLNDFKIVGNIVNVRPGPIITLYEFEPAPGMRSSRIVGLADDIARNMSVKSTRISTIENRTTLGIEIPNAKRSIISLREVMEREEFKKTTYNLPIILGKNISGEPVIIDLSKSPHLLIAGTTGSGKSVSINAMILSLLYKFTPDECKFIMIDPKKLELSSYEGIPHLLTPIVTEPQKAVTALKWVVAEMDDRYRTMAGIGVKNISGYNEKIKKAKSEGKPLMMKVMTGYDEYKEPVYDSREIETKIMPYIVIVIDEMADLMITAGKDIEVLIQRIAQMARAAGIHIIMATQRPSVDIITGAIKANFPSRISFLVSSKIDSKVILSEQGAEQLLGMGDMLYSQNGGSILRAHGPFVSEQEIERVVEYILSEGFKPAYVSNMYEEKQDINIEMMDSSSKQNDDRSSNEDELYKEAVAIVLRDRKTTISYLQRVLRIGYNKSANLIERMEREGILTPPNGVGKREIIE